jgi:hypothetical protein
VVANGIEARLIQAEAALRSGNVTAWITTLNQLRTNGVAGSIDAMWQAGTGGVAGLAPLNDPGIGSGNPDSARVALMFQERAAWLFMTGHRQGDLRRQLRQYSQYWRDQSRVYPSGSYLQITGARYGTDVTAPIPGDEYLNPLFHGCLDRAP